jgi:hypothetical protein
MRKRYKLSRAKVQNAQRESQIRHIIHAMLFFGRDARQGPGPVGITVKVVGLTEAAEELASPSLLGDRQVPRTGQDRREI